MDDAALKTLIEKSYLLNDAQRTFWLTELPIIRPEQKAKLLEILAGSDTIPFQKELEQYVVSLAQNAQKLYATAPKAA